MPICGGRLAQRPRDVGIAPTTVILSYELVEWRRIKRHTRHSREGGNPFLFLSFRA